MKTWARNTLLLDPFRLVCDLDTEMLCLVHVKVCVQKTTLMLQGNVDKTVSGCPGWWSWMAAILFYYCSFLPTLFLNQWLPIVAEMLKLSMKELVSCSYLHLEISDPLLPKWPLAPQEKQLHTLAISNVQIDNKFHEKNRAQGSAGMSIISPFSLTHLCS